VRIGSLFSGAGGLDMAVEDVFNGHTVWQCEIDPAASKVLAYRWGKRRDVPNLGDITKVDWYEVPEIDVLCGGFPCQDVSAAGKRAGIKDGTRSGLWAVFAEIIDIIRPPFVVIENVRGLLSATAHRAVESDDAVVGDRSDRPVLRAIGAVLGDLSDLGYDSRYATVSASSVGAPHRRERVFIVAQSSGAAVGFNTARTPSAEAGAHPGDRSGDHRGKRADVELLPTPVVTDSSDSARHTIVGGTSHPGTSLTDAIRLLPTPCAGDGMGGRAMGRNGTQINLSGIARVMSGDTSGLPDCNELTALLPTPNASDGTGGGQHPDKRQGHSRQLIDYALLCTPTADPGTSRSGSRIVEPLLRKQAVQMASAWGKYEPAIRRWESFTRPAPAPTEPNKNGNPRLSAAFSEWLMGWPDGWVTDPEIGISRNDQLRIVGNGVCPQQAAAALRYLMGSTGNGIPINETPSRSVVLLPTPQKRDGEARASKHVGGIRPSGQPRQKDLNTVTVRELSEVDE